ncbi:MAG: hydroxymethylglutaryl-CoA lyase, partial [Bdellovibrionota bacterium]
MIFRRPRAEIFEVGPRDGLQSQPQILGINDREKFVTGLLDAGFKDIEVGSFVREDRIPQLAGTRELLTRLDKVRNRYKKLAPRFWAFVPNMKGLHDALETSADGLAFFIAASDTFCRKNVNRTQDELFSELEKLLPAARKEGRQTRVYLSTITYCPYEGPIRPSQVTKVVSRLVDLGAKEIALGDTTGHATPGDIERLLTPILKKWKPKLFAMHLHDTRALALANVEKSLEMGISKFDASSGGLGGCPYAPGAAGNLATEDLVYMLQAQGLLKADIDLN